MMHRTNIWEKKWQLEKTMLLFKQQVLVQAAHSRALKTLFKTEEEVVQGSKENPPPKLKLKE